MLVISCSHGKHLGWHIAKNLNKDYSELFVEKFPDDELHIRFKSDLRGKCVILVQSFYKNISDCIIEVILAAKTSRELGAKKVVLVAPYFPYLRQDARFHKGEAVSQKIIAGLIDKYFDGVYIVDPHLHRANKLWDIFRVKSTKLTANPLIADYIKKSIENPIMIGPDEESYKWARNVANIIGVESLILEKKRFSSYNVKVKFKKKVNLKGKSAVIVDDIVSTGHTILETAKILKRLCAKNVYCICVHGIFADEALSKLKKAGVKIASTNTIPNKVAKIDVTPIISESLFKLLH